MNIAIASGKGGAGKTSLSTNLCALMAESMNVVLADLDVEEPNATIFFDTDYLSHPVYKAIPEWDQSRCSSCGKCQEVCNFNAIIQMIDEIIVFPELCHSCHACSILCPESALPMNEKRIGMLREGKLPSLNLLEGRLDIGEEQAVPLIQHAKEILEQKHGEESIVIMDAPPGSSCPVIEVTRDADLVILVTEPNPFGLNDLKIMVETIQLLGREMAVVINKAGKGDQSIEQYCESECIPVIARIPHSRRAAELNSNGHLLINELPEIKKEIEKLSAYIQTNSKTLMQ